VRRCSDPNHPDYEHYGRRGISVFEPWLTDPIAFFQYVESAGKVPGGYSLDRIDNNGNYEPGNLRLVDAATQNANRRDWADPDNFQPCCWCIDCNHDEVTCPVEALFPPQNPEFDRRKARRDYDRTRVPRVIDLPKPRPEPRSWVDDLLDRLELEDAFREILSV
jgi:hypothetical protein